MRILLSAAFIAALGSVAAADTVWLKNGGKLEGVTTTVDGDKLIVKMPSGTIKVDRDQVQKIVHKATAMEEYEIAAAKVKKGDVKGHLALADWCAKKELAHSERVELEAVIAADPDHEEARKRLGFEKVGGKWLRGEELLVARGMVKVEGKWMTKESAAAMAADREKKRLEKELAAAEKKAASEKEDTESDRLRSFYESQERVQRRLKARDRSFDSRRDYTGYSGSYYGGYYGNGLWVGTVGYYPYGYYSSPGYCYPRYYGSSVGLYYHHGSTSFSFGTSHYGSGYGYYPGYYYGGSGYGYSGTSGSYGPVGPSGSSAGGFDRGGAPHYGGSR